MNNLLKLNEVCEILQLSKWTIKKLARNGKIPSILINKRGDRRYRKEDIEAFIQNPTFDKNTGNSHGKAGENV